jgi:LysM repeat protein
MNKSSSSASSTIHSFRKRRQQRGPTLFYILAALFIVAGIIFLVVWLTGPSKPLDAMFATETPTPTVTYTPTSTSTSTSTPTETLTPTITNTPTPSAPFYYTVLEGDYLSSIVTKFNLGPNGIPLILLLNPYNQADGTGIDPATSIVYPGQVILIPNPDMPLPTATPVPASLPRGTKLTYTVQAGDTLGGIAAKFNSTIDAIIKENKITNPNALYVGQQLIIPANLVTPTATRPPTSTPESVTPSPSITPTR